MNLRKRFIKLKISHVVVALLVVEEVQVVVVQVAVLQVADKILQENRTNKANI